MPIYLASWWPFFCDVALLFNFSVRALYDERHDADLFSAKICNAVCKYDFKTMQQASAIAILVEKPFKNVLGGQPGWKALSKQEKEIFRAINIRFLTCLDSL